MAEKYDEDLYFMNRVLDLAEHRLRSSETCDDIPIAACIVENGEIVAEGLNTRENDKSILGHAEINALERAAKVKGTWNLSGCTIYVSLEPCPMCAGAILQSHVQKVVFGAYDIKSGAFGSRYNLRTKNVEVKGGLYEDRSIAILSEFFEKLRELKEIEEEQQQEETTNTIPRN